MMRNNKNQKIKIWKKLPYVDLMEKHLEDYLKQYFIGHYNPKGNLFHAWALKDKLVEKLNPKPAAYPNGLPTSKK